MLDLGIIMANVTVSGSSIICFSGSSPLGKIQSVGANAIGHYSSYLNNESLMFTKSATQ